MDRPIYIGSTEGRLQRIRTILLILLPGAVPAPTDPRGFNRSGNMLIVDPRNKHAARTGATRTNTTRLGRHRTGGSNPGYDDSGSPPPFD